MKPRLLGPLLLAAVFSGMARVGGSPPPGVMIKGDSDFKRRTLTALTRIRRTSTGNKLFQALSRTRRTVTIRFSSQKSAGAATYPTGEGDSLVLWDPVFETKDFPAFLYLYHELLHALYQAQGDRELPKNEEELRTIGLEQYAQEPLCENALRKELKLPLRRSWKKEESADR